MTAVGSFDSYFVAGQADDCWPWLGQRDQDGYGRWGRTARANRLALERKLGRPLRAGALACHSCDNPPCVNPTHLFEGTSADNMADREAKGRTARGERSGSRLHPGSHRGVRNGRAKLTPEQVAEIRVNREGLSQVRAGRKYGVSPGAIWFIRSGRHWIEGPA